MEKNCKWFFGSEGGVDIGPNDPVHQTFKGNPYYSIVREAIQNSLDAVDNNNSPVEVSFTYFELDRLKFPSLFLLQDHIRQAKSYYENNDDAKRLFGDMLDYLDNDEKLQRTGKISCLKISDSNTKGMPFEEGTDSPFYAFLRATGVSFKMTAGSGGSFGFGKGAYFALSPLKTIVVSSKDLNGTVYFEGATRLTTHKNSEGEKLTAYGYYDDNGGNPTIKDENIPEIFRRKKTGTDINIIGLWEDIDRDNLMIKSVLNNFWLAIYENKLIVRVADIVITKENLEQIIDEYFVNEFESGSATEIELWNPKPYFKAVKYVEANDQFKYFTENLPTLGSVKMYVYLQKGLPNRTALFRSPKMVVFKKGSKIINGYAAVFVCEDTPGNEILKLMENPAHNEWRKENYPKMSGKIAVTAKEAEYQITHYINRILQSLSKINFNKKVAFLGLEEFLSIPEDLLENEDSELPGENKNYASGSPSADITKEETGIQTTIVNNVSIKPTIKKKEEVKETSGAQPNEEGELEVTTDSSERGDGPPSPPTPGPEGIIRLGSEGNNNIDSKILRKVELKVAAQVEDEILYHILIINSDYEMANAEMELFVGGDNDRNDGIAILSSDMGQIEGNKLKLVPMVRGKNKIKIRFSDNLKHSIKINVYEFK